MSSGADLALKVQGNAGAMPGQRGYSIFPSYEPFKVPVTERTSAYANQYLPVGTRALYAAAASTPSSQGSYYNTVNAYYNSITGGM